MHNLVAEEAHQVLVGDVTRMKMITLVVALHCSIGCNDASCDT